MLEHTRDAYRVYLEWLFDKVKGDYYENLLYELWKMSYEPTISLDENWSSSGLKLREEFVNGCQGKFNCPGYGRKHKDKKPCSVLEMLISLSITASESIGEGTKWTNTTDWFHTILENLGLTKATNSNFELYKDFLWREIDAVMAHKVEKFGGPYNWFVIERADATKLADYEAVDFAKMDIWRQLLCWVRANSDIENIFERENVILEEEKIDEK